MDTLVMMVHLAETVPLASREIVVRVVPLALLAHPELLVLPDQLVQLADQETVENLVPVDLKAPLAQLVQEVFLDLKAHVVRRVLLERKVKEA